MSSISRRGFLAALGAVTAGKMAVAREQAEELPPLEPGNDSDFKILRKGSGHWVSVHVHLASTLDRCPRHVEVAPIEITLQDGDMIMYPTGDVWRISVNGDEMNMAQCNTILV